MILEITKDERLLILRHLLAGTPLHDPQVTALVNRLIETREASNGTSAPAQPSLNLAPGEPLWDKPKETNQPQRAQESPEPKRDWENAGPQLVRWATDKFDKEKVEQITITPMGAKRDDLFKAGKKVPRMSVSWQSPKVRGYNYATVWDEKLFPWVANRLKQETVFYVVNKGKFTDVVGVKA